MFTHRLVFPASVLRGRGAIKHLGAMCGRLGQRAMLVGGKRAIASVEEKVADQLEQQMVSYLGSEIFNGVCCQEEINRLADVFRTQGVEVIIATGGGKALDTAKAAGVACNIPVVTLPSIAGTCSAVTSLAFRYHQDGEFRDMMPLPCGPAAVVIDADLLATAPLQWLSAGIGDTLAKWYEYRAISDLNQLTGLAGVARTNSELCYTLIEHFAADACFAVHDGKANNALEQVLDAIFLYAGLTSVMSNGAHTGASHALYEGFTACPKTRHIPHGLLVGYSNLCLLALENRSDDELLTAIALARDSAIPTQLAHIATGLTEQDLAVIIDRSLSTPDMANMPWEVEFAEIRAAMERVERLGAKIN
ncbi:iron-containing alcohol dehydrogenase family protein [Rahnella aceris]|jgi:glycerol dehydrogenase|uniref:iron-containing alcohol dehydrogenase family protein n=1 Tax=Rahnella sp. (strain Y9602) TaxID=2703885 RepID=UPI000F7C0A05|nr:iron-containing alcohol dehydrogenase family protein [uncultured Rahnella sp.]AZP42520.1 iron-containing alcohol dehydrogenase family protein [Rahnella aquatilis]AZP46860.1 iron-containing alcohol dehydrogenase family protein [Rahnella aquatilis]